MNRNTLYPNGSDFKPDGFLKNKKTKKLKHLYNNNKVPNQIGFDYTVCQ